MAENMIVYKCPECGAEIRFSASDERVVCHHCDAKFSIKELVSVDVGRMDRRTEKFNWLDFAENIEHEVWSDDEAEKFRTYKCSHCGGEIVGDATAMSSVCPYCDNPVVVTGTIKGMLRPDYIIPFKKTRENALEIYRQHIRDTRFVSSKFRKLADGEPDEVKGIYVPFWLFDCKTENEAEFRAEHGPEYENDPSTVYSVKIKGIVNFNNIPEDASLRMNDELMESIEPYNYDGLERFNSAYLTGFYAERFSVKLTDRVGRVHKRIEKSVYDVLKNNIENYDVVNLKSLDTELLDGYVRYALLPVWLMDTEYAGKKYTIVVNGQTGKLAGDIPISIFKFALFLLAVFGVTFGVVLLIMMKFLFII